MWGRMLITQTELGYGVNKPHPPYVGSCHLSGWNLLSTRVMSLVWMELAEHVGPYVKHED